eukprot:scaffold4715_cov115-Cylindrotheca_fusiformis.AAC.7
MHDCFPHPLAPLDTFPPQRRINFASPLRIMGRRTWGGEFQRRHHCASTGSQHSKNISKATMTEEKEIAPLFRSNDDVDSETTAELFRDRVRSLHEHFDKDGDGHLNFEELAALQKATEGVILSEEMYVMACKALDCIPNKGISMGALKLTYASEGADISKTSSKSTSPIKS